MLPLTCARRYGAAGKKRGGEAYILQSPLAPVRFVASRPAKNCPGCLRHTATVVADIKSGGIDTVREARARVARCASGE